MYVTYRSRRIIRKAKYGGRKCGGKNWEMKGGGSLAIGR